MTAIGLGSVAFFAVVSWTVNGQPSTRPFQGWIAVLEPADAISSGDRVALILEPVVPGAPGAHPVLAYTVVVCGDRPFRGELLIGGDARLTGLRADPSLSDAEQVTVGSAPDLVIGDERTGGVRDLGAAQVIALNMTTIVPCAPSSPSDLFAGTAITLTGNAGAAVQRHWDLAWWSAPRQSEAWPLLGSFPGVSIDDLGMFEGISGLSGSWTRPVQSHFEVHVGSLTAKTSIDVAVPASTDPTGLGWAMPGPFQATARLTDSDATSRWQQLLVLAGVALGLGGGLLASQLFEWGRARQPADPPQNTGDLSSTDQHTDPPNAMPALTGRPSTTTPLPWMLAGAAIGAAIGWIAQAPRRSSRRPRR